MFTTNLSGCYKGFVHVVKKRWIMGRIQNIMWYVSIVDRRALVSIWSHNPSWSQAIAEDRRWFYLMRLSAITFAGSQTIAEVCFIWSQNFLQSAISDPRSSAIIWKPAFNVNQLLESICLELLVAAFRDSTPSGKFLKWWHFCHNLYCHTWVSIWQLLSGSSRT